MYGLQTSSPITLILEGFFEGDIELSLHKEFNDHKVRNEWFEYSIIKTLKEKEGFILPVIEEKKEKEGTITKWTNAWLMYKDNLGAEEYVSATVWKELLVGDIIPIRNIEGYTQKSFFEEVIGIEPSRKWDNSNLTVMEIMPEWAGTQLNSWGESEGMPLRDFEEALQTKRSIFDTPHEGIALQRKRFIKQAAKQYKEKAK